MAVPCPPLSAHGLRNSLRHRSGLSPWRDAMRQRPPPASLHLPSAVSDTRGPRALRRCPAGPAMPAARAPLSPSPAQTHRCPPVPRRPPRTTAPSMPRAGRPLPLRRRRGSAGPQHRALQSAVRRRPPLTSALREPFSTCLVRAITSVPQLVTFSVSSPFTECPKRA